MYQLGAEDTGEIITTDTSVTKLEKRLKEWFSVAGIDYRAVESLGMDAIARADVLRGVLEVVEGRRDRTTLAEEASHFLVEMLPEDNSMLRGILKVLKVLKC